MIKRSSLSFKIRSIISLGVMIGTLTAGLIFQPAFAVTYLSHASVIETNMVAGGTSAVYVSFTAGAADVASNFTVNFNGWTGGAAGIVNGTQTVSTANCQAVTGATNTLPTSTSLTATGATSIVTVAGATALTSGSSYCFELTGSAVTNPTSAGQSKVTLTSVTTNDTTNVEVDAITSDTYTVSATVPPSFTLSLSGTTDAFASNLSSSSTVVTTGVTATINTNAANGWGLWAMDSQAGLHSTLASTLIGSVATGSNHTFTTGSNQYGLGVSTFNTANYAYGGGTTGGGLSTSQLYEIATNNAPASGVTTVIHELADVSATTPAAQDYSDVVTVVGAGSF